MDVDELEWDESNETHCAQHGVTPGLVEAVLDGQSKLFPNRAGMTGTHMMVGPDINGRFWTIILLHLQDARWRPITGWPSTGQEIQRYKGEA